MFIQQTLRKSFPDYIDYIDYTCMHLLPPLLINFVKSDHFSAQETPEENLPTDKQLEKAKLLCCFRQAKQ